MKKGAILVAILLLPSIIYMLFSLGEHNVKRLPSYGPYEVADNGDTNWASAPNIKLVDNAGNPKLFSDYEGKVIVLDFFDFPCDSICKTKGATLANYLHKLDDTDKWVILSLSVNPNVTVAELEALRQKHMPSMDNWFFVKADTDRDVHEGISFAFAQSGRKNGPTTAPNEEFVLLDQQGVMRAFFNSRIQKDDKSMADAIKLLMREPYVNWKDDEREETK